MRARKPAPDTAKALSIIEAAAYAFALAGYHRTQMSDIAAGAGVALGTLYRYAESKEELFACALALGTGRDPFQVLAKGPVLDVETFFVQHLPEWFAWSEPGSLDRRFLLLDGTPIAFEAMLAAFYDTLASHRLAIRILDRSAHDLPKLNEVYVNRVREPAMRVLLRHLEELVSRGEIPPVESIAASARFILETCAWFAMHRLFSPGGAEISDDLARQTALSHLKAAFGARAPRGDVT